MAIALVSNNRGTTTSTSGGTNPIVDLPAGASITVGSTLILTAAYDNSGTLGVDPNMWIVSSAVVGTQLFGLDLRGNLWFRIAKAVRNTGGAANDGSVADIWACRVNVAYLNGDDITLQFSFPVAGLVVRIAEFSGVNTRSYSVVTAVTGVGNGTSITAPAINPGAANYMVVAVGAIETNTAITGDADTTNGSWVTMSNDVANSGVDATSQTLFAQHKIVNATGAQNWTATKTGAADWAALAVVFAEFVNVAPGYVSGNPNYPCIAGAEVLPLGNDFLPIDTGTEYYQSHQIFANSNGTQNYAVASNAFVDPLGSGVAIAQHTFIHEVYRDGASDALDEAWSEPILLSAAGLGGGATVSSGTVADALVSPGGAYVTLPNNGYVDVLFNPATLTTIFPNYRIVNWGIRFMAWKDDSSLSGAPGEGIKVEWRDSAANNGAGAASVLGAWLVQNYKRDAQYETRWLGETNPIIRGKGEILVQNSPTNAAFTVNDLSHMAVGDQTTRLRIYGAAGQQFDQTTTYLDYIYGIVQLVPERRVAHATRQLSLSPDQTSALAAWFAVAFGIAPTWSALNTNNHWQVSAAPSDVFVLGTREAIPSSPSDYYANLTSTAIGSIPRTLGGNEAIGPSFLMQATTQPRAALENADGTGQPVLRRGIINNGLLAATPEDLDEFVISIAPYDQIRLFTDGSFFPGYAFSGSIGDLSEAYAGGDITTQVTVSGSTQFNRVKVLVQPDDLTTANLTITVEKPALTVLATAVLTVAQALTCPDAGNGWREISLALNVAVTPTAGQAVIRFSTTTPVTAPWRIARSTTMNGFDQFGYNPGVGNYDTAAVLECTLANPTYILANDSVNLYRPDGRCIDDAVILPKITLSNAGLYDWVSIERAISNGGGTEWQPVVMLENPTNADTYTDTGAPWGIPTATIFYRIRGYRDADHLMVESITPAWVGTIAPPGAAFGLAATPPQGDSPILYVYTPVDQGSLQVVWSPLNPVSTIPLLGVDYQIPLRAPEERGVSTSFMVVVDQLSSCENPDGRVSFGNEDLGIGPYSFSPTPFDQLREMGDTERVQLILPGGYTQWVTVGLGSMTITTQFGVYLAEMTLTPVTAPSVEPYPDGPTNVA